MARCISPLLIRRDGERNVVPCGKCNFCLQTKRADWSFRLVQEQKRANTAYFLTLTYDDATLPLHEETLLPTLVKRDLQLFKKRVRKENLKHTEDQVRYYSVGEYGTQTKRPHYHSIIFNLSPDLDIMKLWPYGFISIGTVNIASIHYTTKYVVNRVGEYAGREPPFALMSRRPAIGSNYLDTHTKWHRADRRNYTRVNGRLGRLPRYYKEKIFNSLERKIMASQGLATADIEYWKEIDRLSNYHNDPMWYHEEIQRNSHELVLKNINSKNTF